MPVARTLLDTFSAVMIALPGLAMAGEQPKTAAAALTLWAEAYASNEGPRAADLYTADARLWGSVSREQTVGQPAIAAYFARPRPLAAAINVQFGDYVLRDVAPGVAVASGHYTFIRERWDGSELAEASRFSMTLVQGSDGVWRIADHHSSRLPPAPQAAAR